MMQIFELYIILYMVIFIHEMGHYLTAKLLGIGVEEVQIGGGFVLFQWHRFSAITRKDETWRIGIIPLMGCTLHTYPVNLGFRKLRTEDFCARPKWQQGLVILNGPVFNIATAAVYGLLVMDYSTFSNVSLLFALWSLLPLKGSDGWRITKVV